MAELLKKLFIAEGIAEPTGSNHPLLLTGRDDVWFLMAGKADIFTVGLTCGKPSGSRSCFFSLNEGDLIFGTGPDIQVYGRALIAVGPGGSQWLRMSREELTDPVHLDEIRDELAGKAEAWIRGLSFAISRDINPETDILIDKEVRETLQGNKKFRSRKGVTWVRFVRGNALLTGIREVRNPDESLFLPLTTDSWAQTTEESDIVTCDTPSLIETGHFHQSLNFFHEAVMYCEMLNTKLLMVDEINRIRERVDNREKQREGATLMIASVLDRNIDRHIRVYDPDPLVMACRLVANVAGIDIQIPDRPRHENPKPLELEEISRFSGFRFRSVLLDEGWWKSDCGPLLGYTGIAGHPVALLPVRPGVYDCIDPLTKGKTRIGKETARSLNTEAHQFFRPFPTRILNWYDLLKFGTRGTKADFLLILVLGIAGGLLGLLLPLLTGVIFDKVIPHKDTHELIVLSIAVFSSLLSVALFNLVRSFGLLRIESRMDFQLQAAFWDRILNMPVSFFRQFSSGELATKAQTLSNLRKTLSGGVIGVLVSGLFALFNFLLLYYYDPFLAMVTSGIFFISIGFIVITGWSIYRNQKKIVAMQNKIYGFVIQLLNSVSKLKIAGAETLVYSLWAEKFSGLKKASVKVKIKTAAIQVFMLVLPVIATGLVFALTVYSGRGFSTGEFLAFFTAFAVCMTIIFQFGIAGISIFTALPMYEDLKPVLQTLPENVGARHEFFTLNGEIEMNEINFRYNREGPMVIKNLSLHILPGEFVAIVGPSGSGKSTLVRLLLGFDTPESGSIYYDKQDFSRYDPRSVRKQIGTVLQESRLASGPILTGITGVSGASMDDAWAAAAKVGLDEDIRQMPMGMFTVINDGLSTLSGGQRQRIMLARALVSNPRILILDEATSALDNKTQRVVSESLSTLQATRIVIAHRLSTVREADRIFVLDKGQIVEEGKFGELMSGKGHFASLVERQMICI